MKISYQAFVGSQTYAVELVPKKYKVIASLMGRVNRFRRNFYTDEFDVDCAQLLNY